MSAATANIQTHHEAAGAGGDPPQGGDHPGGHGAGTMIPICVSRYLTHISNSVS